MPVPKPTEIATLRVNGVDITNWKRVLVQHRWAEAFHIFEFETAESMPAPLSYLAMQPNIGDMVDIYLADIQAMHGPVTTRQSASDANSHGVQIIGKTLSWQMAKSSLRTQTGNYNGWDLISIARDICSKVNVGVEIIGQIDTTPFANCQHAPGEPA